MNRYWLTLVYGVTCTAVLLSDLSASAITLEWIRNFDAGGGLANAESHSADALGNVYLTGYTFGNFGATNAGFTDVFLCKYDAAGNQIWIRQIGSIVGDDSRGVSTDAAGNVFIGGVTGNGQPPGTNGLFGPIDDYSDAFLAKYDAAGNLLWGRQFSVTNGGENKVQGVAADNFGHVYVAGWTSSVPFDLSHSDVLLAKYDSDGNQIWARSLILAVNRRDFAEEVTTDILGNVLIVGDMSSAAYVAKYDADGNQVWLRNLPDAHPLNESTGLCTDGMGNVYISGPTVNHDAFVTKYNATGDLQWTRLLVTPDLDRSYGVALDGLGNLYVSGQTRGNLDGAHPGLAANSAFLARYDAEDGTLQWVTQFDATTAFRVTADGSGTVYVSGYGPISAPGMFLAKFSDAVPEPSTLILAALGLVPAVFRSRYRSLDRLDSKRTSTTTCAILLKS